LNKDIAKLSAENSVPPLKPRPNLRTVEAEEKRIKGEEEISDRSHLSFGS
jgi:hypothetical protein